MLSKATIVGLVLLASSVASAASMDLPWPVEARKVNAVAVEGDRAFLATGDNGAELVVVELATGATLGTFDAAGGADALSVRVVAPGQVKLGRRQSDAPEVYHLEVSDPAAIVVLDTGERARHVRWKPEPIPPARFADVNGDGVYRLACLGDSNTAPLEGFVKWCELLEQMIADPAFEVVNFGWGGATACENKLFVSTGALQMEQALAADVDAVVLAFGTNDRLQHRTTDEIIAAHLALAEVAELAGVALYVAQTPPMGGCEGRGCGGIYWGNIVLQFAFPGRVIDFFSGVGDEHFRAQDQIHHNDAGQVLRAERAAAMIASPLLATAR